MNTECDEVFEEGTDIITFGIGVKEEEDKNSLGNLLIGIVAIAALLALVAVLIAVCFYMKKKR